MKSIKSSNISAAFVTKIVAVRHILRHTSNSITLMVKGEKSGKSGTHGVITVFKMYHSYLANLIVITAEKMGKNAITATSLKTANFSSFTVKFATAATECSSEGLGRLL